MDLLLSRVTAQAVNYAIRSGITITGGYAIKQCARLLKSTPKGDSKEELLDLQLRLESKIRIISPAIDMIELIAARGNTTLESAVTLTKEIRWEIQSLGIRLANAANEEELSRRRSAKAKSREQNEAGLKLVTSHVRKLLSRIEDAVPLINLAITTSGVSLSTTLPATISPSRLLQASTFLSAADGKYSAEAGQPVQVGPVYTLSLYMLFAGHAWRPYDDDDVRETTWKEVMHKAKVKLVRVPLDSLYDLPHSADDTNSDDSFNAPRSIPGEGAAFEYAYRLVLIEDLEDDRVHSFDDNEAQPGPFEDVAMAGIRDLVPIHEISKIFYADTGKILNIGTEGEANSPVLLLKRDIHAEPPRRMMERRSSEDDGVRNQDDEDGEDEFGAGSSPIDEKSELDAQFRRDSSVAPANEVPVLAQDQSHWRLPPDLDPEWIALEVYTEESDSDDEEDPITEDTRPVSSRRTSSRQGSLDPALTGALSKLKLKSASPVPSEDAHLEASTSTNVLASGQSVPVKTSLSLLEMLIRLTALQQFRQSSHLTIEDELLNFFLEDSATTGAGPNAEYRQRVRRDARRRVGFDPYDESPIKRRGEEYLAHPRASPRPDRAYDQGSYFGDDDYGRQWEASQSPEYIRPSTENPRFPNRGVNTPSSPSPVLRPRPRSTKSSPIPSTPGFSRSAQSLATPPGSLRSRAAVLRSQSEKPKSPLGRGGHHVKHDSTLGTSPSSENLRGSDV